jgi:putative transposase
LKLTFSCFTPSPLLLVLRVPHSRRGEGAGFAFALKNRLERRYGQRHLHFITCSCYRRLPMLGKPRNRDLFLTILNEVRARYEFFIVGYGVMPEHVHLLISEPKVGTPSTVTRVLKQRVSRAARKTRQRRNPNQLELWGKEKGELRRSFWQRRFYDFNVWSRKKRIEKLHYMHMNPVKRGLVADPKLWVWSSYRFFQYGEKGLCPPDLEPR